jgi:uncharacterized protein (TIGR03083 family)
MGRVWRANPFLRSTMTADPSATLQYQRQVLAASNERLAGLVAPLSAADLRKPAYPTEWTIADVLSHLGSGAVISRLRMDGDVEPQAIWDEWNAKDPEAQATDALVADRQLLDRLAKLTAEDEERARFALGPMELDLTTFLGLRLNEHALHTWDVAVALDPSATLSEEATTLILDGALPLLAGFAGKPTGADRAITVRTADPTRHVTVTLRPDGVAVSLGEPVDAPDLTLPAEAFVRLVFGRFDPGPAVPVDGDAADLDELRRAFPGF